MHFSDLRHYGVIFSLYKKFVILVTQDKRKTLMTKTTTLALKSILLLSLFFMTQVAKSQNDYTQSAADSLTGTWAGTFRQINDNSENRQNTFIWRIHKIDIARKQVELTEIGNHFNNGLKIDDPKKSTYRGFFEKNRLVIEFKGKKSNTDITFRLEIKRMDGMLMLQEISAPDIKTGQSTLICMLGKISDDTSKYQKPKKGEEVEVATASPPPLKK